MNDRMSSSRTRINYRKRTNTLDGRTTKPTKKKEKKILIFSTGARMRTMSVMLLLLLLLSASWHSLCPAHNTTDDDRWMTTSEMEFCFLRTSCPSPSSTLCQETKQNKMWAMLALFFFFFLKILSRSWRNGRTTSVLFGCNFSTVLTRICVVYR